MLVRNKLPRSLTLKSRVEISVLLKQGRRVYASSCSAVWQPADSFRYGIFLSRRHGKAHERNRIKRIFREALRLSRNQLAASVKLAILPRVGEKLPPFEEVKADVTRLLDQINRYA